MEKQEGNYLEVATIKKVEEDGEYYQIEKQDGWMFCLAKKYGITPKVGNTVVIRSWGGKFGQIMGVQINDKVAFDKTNTDMEAEHKAFCDNFHREEWEGYYKTLEAIKTETPFETVDISGMSGGYEVACQRMLRAGINYLKDKPDFHFDYEGFERIYGICFTETPWGKDLDKILMEAVNNDCTGAMHQCVIGHLSQIHKHGLEWWLKQFPKERRYKFPTELPKPKCPNPVALNVKDFTREGGENTK
jgi:hypothetical protein